MTSATADFKHLQRLCCSGLSGEALLPELLRELRSVVPSRSNAFMWCDDKCEITNSCSEDPVFWQIMPVSFTGRDGSKARTPRQARSP